MIAAATGAMLLGLSGCNKSKGAGAGTAALGADKTLGGLVVKAPTAWTESPPSSSMRLGQWTIGSGESAAELVVYHFGAAGAGSAEANLDRWFGQFEQADGTSSREAAKVENKTIAGMPVTRAEVSGRYVAEVRPGAGERHDQADWAMLGAIVDSGQGAYYFKLVGPKATVHEARAAFDAMLDSMKKAP